MVLKRCSKCGREKILNTDNFRFLNTTNCWCAQCRDCERIIRRLHYSLNKNKYKIDHDNYVKNNRSKINKNNNTWYHNNKFKLTDKQKTYYINNQNKIKEYNKLPHVRKARNAYKKEKRNSDLFYKLHGVVSNAIRSSLRKSFKNKNGSVNKYLPYTIRELKEHLEKQFEPWMNWNNYGKASRDKITWQIDHIIPQSLLKYDSMTHPNFLKCWDLSNLRLMKAIDNIKKGKNVFNVL